MPLIVFQQLGGLEWPSFSVPLLLITLVLSALILYRRYRSRQMLVDRIAELENLSDVGRAIAAAQLDLSALCELIAGQIAHVIDISTFQIGTFEEATYKIYYWSIDGERQHTPQSFDLGDNGGLIGWVRDTLQPLRVRDFQKEMSALPAQPRYMSQNPPRSAIFIPLVSGQSAIGIIAAQSAQPNAYTQRDFSRLMIVANQATAAIANAQIYEQERKRASQLELVGNIARQVNAINDLDDLLQQVVQLTRETFDFGSVNVFLVDLASSAATIQASTIPHLAAGSLCFPPDQGLVGTAMAKRSTTLSNNTEDDDRFFSDAYSTETCSEICIPLIVDKDLLGVLDVQSPKIGAFDTQERGVLEALAAQVAVAIHKARQISRQRKQSWLATAQLQVAEAISRSPDLDSLAETVVRLTTLLVGVDHCAILLWDEESNSYEPVTAYGYPDSVDVVFKNMTLPIGDWKAMDAVHVGEVPLTTQQAPPWLNPADSRDRRLEGRLYTLLPLISKDNILGIMVMDDTSLNLETVSENRLDLLRNILTQTAQGIDSILMHTAQQEEAWVNTALLQVAEAVNKLTDLNEILHTIVRLVPMLVGVKASVILIHDEDNHTYRAGPSHGLTEMGHGLLDSFEIDLAEFPLLETQDVDRLGPDAEFYTFKLPDWMDTVMGSDTADILPLRARGKLVGLLVVGPSLNGRPLSGRRLNIVTGIAQQAAVAVVNDQLYKESAERGRYEQELNVAYSIQASLIPDGAPDIPGCSVASYWQAARQVSGDFYDFMKLADGRWAIAIADVADKGVPAALFMALSRTILRTIAFNRREPAKVLERSNKLIYGDTSSDLFVTVFYAIWDPENQTLSYASGGHNPAILVSRRGKISLLSTEGIALGVLENVKIGQKQVKLAPGDTVVFYTDGVSEAMNEDYDEFGMERLCMVIKDARRGTAAEIVQTITQAIDDHSGETAQFDDITMVVLKR